jgi:hypothetical protein
MKFDSYSTRLKKLAFTARWPQIVSLVAESGRVLPGTIPGDI